MKHKSLFSLFVPILTIIVPHIYIVYQELHHSNIRRPPPDYPIVYLSIFMIILGIISMIIILKKQIDIIKLKIITIMIISLIISVLSVIVGRIILALLINILCLCISSIFLCNNINGNILNKIIIIIINPVFTFLIFLIDILYSISVHGII